MGKFKFKVGDHVRIKDDKYLPKAQVGEFETHYRGSIIVTGVSEGSHFPYTCMMLDKTSVLDSKHDDLTNIFKTSELQKVHTLDLKDVYSK